MKSTNHIVITEPYKGARGIKSKISSGVAVVQQKTGVIGLKVLMDAEISKDILVKAGSTVYIKEEILVQFADQYSKALESDAVGQPFVPANYAHVLFVDEGK